jgi:hypothetical protein
MALFGVAAMTGLGGVGRPWLLISVAFPVLAALVLWGRTPRERVIATLAASAMFLGLNASRFGLGQFLAGTIFLIGGAAVLGLTYGVPRKRPSTVTQVGDVVFWIVFALLVSAALLMPLIMGWLGYDVVD